MARNKSNGKSSSSAEKWKFKGFRNVIPTREEKDTYAAYAEAGSRELEDHLVVLSEAGWKVSFSYDPWKSAYCFSVTGKRVAENLNGWCFCFYHVDCSTAIGFGSWYISVVASSDRFQIEDEVSEFDW